MRGEFTRYRSPTGSGTNDGALPTVYDPAWGRFDNLTQQQQLAFMAFPEDLLNYAKHRRWLAEISGLNFDGVSVATQDRDQAKVHQLHDDFANNRVKGAVRYFDATGKVHSVDGQRMASIHAAVRSHVRNTYEVAADIVAGIKDGTIKTRKQIDDAYAAIAPLSPSATNPSPV